MSQGYGREQAPRENFSRRGASVYAQMAPLAASLVHLWVRYGCAMGALRPLTRPRLCRREAARAGAWRCRRAPPACPQPSQGYPAASPAASPAPRARIAGSAIPLAARCPAPCRAARTGASPPAVRLGRRSLVAPLDKPSCRRQVIRPGHSLLEGRALDRRGRSHHVALNSAILRVRVLVLALPSLAARLTHQPWRSLSRHCRDLISPVAAPL